MSKDDNFIMPEIRIHSPSNRCFVHPTKYAFIHYVIADFCEKGETMPFSGGINSHHASTRRLPVTERREQKPTVVPRQDSVEQPHLLRDVGAIL